jgi:hypothetical protein
MMMRKTLVAIAASALLCASAPVKADDHLVARATVGSRLSDAASERAQALASLDGLLGSARAARVAQKAGIDLGQVRGGLPQLSDSELRDLSHRAAVLESNPAAGHEYDEATHLVILLLIVAVAAAVVIAVARNA